MRTRTASLLLAALVVLAGCTGSATHQETTATETETETTTAATTDATATTTDTVAPDADTATPDASADLPPGVNASGVENASQLVAAHRAALSESGFAFRLTVNASYEGLSDSLTVSRGTAAKDFAPFRIRSDVTARQDGRTIRGETDTWGNESVVLAQYRLDDRTVYQKELLAPNGTAGQVSGLNTVLPIQVSQSFVVGFALQSGDYEVASVETRDGLTLTTLRATDYNRSFEGGVGNVTRYDSTLVVDERGRVRQLDTTLESDETAVRLDFELTKVGGVVVPYPRWADRALAAVSAQIDVDADSTGDYFVVSNEGGDTLPPGSAIRASHAGANATLELTDPLAPGERVYVYFPTEGEDGARPVLAADPPAEGETAPLDGEYEFEVVDPAGNPLLNVGFGFETSVTTATPVGNDSTADATTRSDRVSSA